MFWYSKYLKYVEHFDAYNPKQKREKEKKKKIFSLQLFVTHTVLRHLLS